MKFQWVENFCTRQHSARAHIAREPNDCDNQHRRNNEDNEDNNIKSLGGRKSNDSGHASNVCIMQSFV